MKNLKIVFVLMMILVTSQVFATDVVEIRGSKNRVKLLTLVLRAASENKDVIFRGVVDNGTGNYSYVKLNGQSFMPRIGGKIVQNVQVSRKLYAEIVNKYINNRLSEVSRDQLINKFCVQQTAFLKALIRSLKPKVIVPPSPQVDCTSAQETRTAYQLVVNSNSALYNQYQAKLVDLRARNTSCNLQDLDKPYVQPGNDCSEAENGYSELRRLLSLDPNAYEALCEDLRRLKDKFRGCLIGKYLKKPNLECSDCSIAEKKYEDILMRYDKSGAGVKKKDFDKELEALKSQYPNCLDDATIKRLHKGLVLTGKIVGAAVVTWGIVKLVKSLFSGRSSQKRVVRKAYPNYEHARDGYSLVKLRKQFGK